jgi:hypothetical protein
MTVIEESFILEGKKFAMAAPTLPHEVTEHLEAAIQLSNSQVHLRFLNEAEALIALNLPAEAVMIAGVVLESILTGLGARGIRRSAATGKMV